MESTGVCVSELGYIELGVSDLSKWHSYAEEVLGLSVRAEADALLLKMDADAWRIRVVETGEDDIRCAAFGVADVATLASISERLSRLGVSVASASDADKAARGVAQLMSCEDPFGLRIELFVGDRSSNQPFISPQQVSGFVTGEQGLGHIVLFVADEKAAIRFYQEGLGFRLSDHITMGPAGRAITVTFLHCNPRHHTVALAPVPLPRKLNHIMLQVALLDDVGLGLDRATQQATPISSGIGCHTNDRMVSFYMQTPSGFDIEYGYGGVEIDDASWKTSHYDKPSIWGHKGNLN